MTTQLLDTCKKYYRRHMIKTPLDRRVSVVLEGEVVELRLSELRGMPCLVLLGEPGIGKSTALEYEASQEGGELLTCREAMNGVPIASASTAYLDALDEYRAGENGKDKLLQLANTITQSGVRRWRLTCRAEDWREAADMRAMRRAASEHPITVAHLLPLDDTEAETVLSGLGEAHPERFLADARARGAGAFLENPLSLQLLHSVVASGGLWPSTRFELFDRAIYALAHEHDPERVNDRRPPVDDIVETAGQLSFYLLASGARALWRSNALAVGSRAKDFVVVQSLAIDPELADFSLDTAIFRGEGQTFEPSHRTIAEFLAGRFLAELVTGEPTGALFPLARAIALITGNDHKAPSELRGLYAWFAAHLSQKGDEKGALRLIERDAATVLAYGDAAAFSTNGRRAILITLDREDPFFLSSRDAITVFGGLAGDDLVPDFLSILDSEVTSHLQLTVLQALADGPPLVGMQNKLHEIAVDPARPLWQRQRAAEAWVKGSSEPGVARRRLIAELSRTTKSYDQISLRADVLSDIPTQELSHQEISDLLSDLNELAPAADGESEESGNLFSLLLKLKKSPRPDLFDRPIIRKPREDRGVKLEVRHFMQASLADAINNNLDVEATRLWSWIRNTRDYEWDRLEEPLAKAIGAWIDVDKANRELDLFAVLLESSPAEEGPWMATNHYITIARRVPDDILIENLLGLAGNTSDGPRRRRLFEVAAYAVRSESQWPKWEGRIVEALENEGNFLDLIADLRKDPNKSWKEQEEKRKAKELAETDAARAHNIASLEPNLNAIAAGRDREFGALKWASELYRDAVISKKEPPLSRIEHFTNARIASAIAEGFIQFAIHTDIKVDAADLGKAEATNGSYVQEYVVAAGIHQALMGGREEEIGNSPPVIAIVALRQNYFSGDERPSLASWGVKHLAHDIAVGSDEILRYWHAALDAGDQDLDAIHHLASSQEPDFLSIILKRLLEERPNLPPRALTQALTASARILSRIEMANLTERALAEELDIQSMRLWQSVALILDPEKFEGTHTSEEIRAAFLAPDGDLVTRLHEICPRPDQLDRLQISTLASTHPLEDRDWARPEGPSGIIRAAINRLSASCDPDGGNILKSLIASSDPSWRPLLTHAAAEHARLLRDNLFIAPSVAELKAALAGGAPASPADLVAVVLEEIERYRSTLRTGSEMPWKRYWNTDHNGAPEKPQIENEDRDRLLELLKARLQQYGVAAAMPEARRGENTRADILLLSHAGRNLPIEAKRHFNSELWTAPKEQLAGYAADEGAIGYGIYLVFWFGNEYRVPTRRDGSSPPTSAGELEAMLRADLPSSLQERISIIVLDVSRPETVSKPKSSRKKSIKSEPLLPGTKKSDQR
ncbi:NACHT domain-containing protein [Sinorhizobium medicae]|uniref:NACHT domain-containing protein n=1 Tax=Sinorhizobium medicae TaxID=110321 RepID=UPI0011A027A2|nr:hypothetical protein [Sinorhizobium medicae]MDX0469244.1 hypothetical protein [Sinorhizobium medicae]MDX0551608.1 hypothetical protein [Sinorhizobium medicae]MDX0660745.1 hypothetical protein [Sinorhizobium medicae]MDX1019173.1 hypothetical protein [Sinorhizobium medicae]MDX1071081.1 hypothetical protein [Sinorhizobium medicae]